MPGPRLKDLPPPPPGKTGWPWTEACPQLPNRMPDGNPWPRISIVTPSYNQGQFIEETIRSVLLQGYPDLEYIIIDGGSTDESVKIIQRYESWLAHWVSEKDRGQSHAINKGFEQVTGDIVAWLNSDDIYLPAAFEYVAERYAAQTEPGRFWLVMPAERYDEISGKREVNIQQPFNQIQDWVFANAQVNQQGAFWARSINATAGPLDETLHLGMDTEFFARLVKLGYKMQCTDSVVAGRFRVHPASKTTNFHGEVIDRSCAFEYDWTLVRLRYLPRPHPCYHAYRKKLLGILAYYHIRFSQDANKSRLLRLTDLIRALRCQPSSIMTKAFLSSLRRILR